MFENVSPPLRWSQVPPATASLALTMIDTHPVARGYLHWFVVDIDPATAYFPEGAASDGLPSGREAKPYVGPFPPSGTHDYEFSLYALDGTAPLPTELSVGEFLRQVQGHVLEATRLTGTFTKR
jgi:Raf kinase inhibitor-like YbhB/YbcL family protein